MNQPAFEKFVANTRMRLVTWAQHCGADDQTGEDLVQDTLLRLWMMHNELREETETEALAKLIIRRRFIDRYRQQSHFVETPPERQPHRSAPSPQEHLESSEAVKLLEQRMEKLPSGEYAVLKLRQVNGLSNEEVARLTGITPASVSTLLSRARKQLLQYIRQQNMTL